MEYKVKTDAVSPFASDSWFQSAEFLSASPSSSPAASSSPPTLRSPHFSRQSSPAASAVVSPCAACKTLRRRCIQKCVLAPYFPPSDPFKFIVAHRVFGASNIIKFLQDLPESSRSDAVSSMVYEANARLRDPVYGCAGAIFHLQKQISELQAQLAKAHADAVHMECQQANLLASLCREMSPSQENQQMQRMMMMMQTQPHTDLTNLADENWGANWETLLT